MQDNPVTLDDLLAPYEARPVPLSRDEIAERKSGLALGAELNRLQGKTASPTIRRLLTLWSLGQATERECLALLARISRLDPANAKEAAMDGR